MKKEIFVSNSLPDIRKKLTQAAYPDNSANIQVENSEQKNISSDKTVQNSISNNREFSKALELRYQEFARLKRDVLAQITLLHSSIPGKIELYEDRIQKLSAAHAKLNSLAEELHSMDKQDLSGTTVTELGRIIKSVENARLEYLRISANLDDISSGNVTDTNGTQGFLPEILSLSFRQLIKLGFGFFFPLLVTIIAAVLVLGMIIIFAMGG